MKKILWIGFFGLLLSACKKDVEETAPSNTGIVEVRVTNVVNDAPIQSGVFNYENALGEAYSINLLKYYLSNAKLISSDGSEVPFANYTLVDGLSSSSNSFSACVPNGQYTQLKCAVGVDHHNNHSGDQEGDLDPINGMLWTWSTGYIFFKHEGQFIDGFDEVQELLYHYGTDAAYTEFSIPINITIDNSNKIINLQFDLAALYNASHQIVFEGNNFHQSVEVEDEQWLQDLKDNFESAFSVISVQ
jgi:hypothetical protein